MMGTTREPLGFMMKLVSQLSSEVLDCRLNGEPVPQERLVMWSQALEEVENELMGLIMSEKLAR